MNYSILSITRSRSPDAKRYVRLVFAPVCMESCQTWGTSGQVLSTESRRKAFWGDVNKRMCVLVWLLRKCEEGLVRAIISLQRLSVGVGIRNTAILQFTNQLQAYPGAQKVPVAGLWLG